METFFQILTVFGQILEILGAWLLYKYGISRHIQDSSVLRVGTLADEKREQADNLQYVQLSRFGFLLVLIGFTLQFFQSMHNLVLKILD
ncbi:MAG: hypothetical protein SFW35_07785 [Chitinophagales bacterium]|nr:hypothetical protein [Chitinophagales bacterium]